MLATEMRTGEIPDIYRRFAEFIGDNHWQKRVAQIKQAVRGNRFLGELLLEENTLAFQLEHLRVLHERFGSIPALETENRKLYPAMSFASQVLSLAQASPNPFAEQLRRRIHGAFKKPDAMRGLQLELSVATHFTRRMQRLTWPEMTRGGTFDLLIEELGPGGLEVECKSIGEDKGRKIHKREALEFYRLLWPLIKPITKDLRIGLSAVLTLPGRLPEQHKHRVDLAHQFAQAILGGTGKTFSDGVTVRVSEFDPAMLGDVPHSMQPTMVRTAIDEVSKTKNRETMLIGTHAGGALALTLQSAQDDSMLKAIFDTLSDSARRQFTGQRGAIFVVGLHGMEGDQLLSIAEQDHDARKTPTALRIGVSQFLVGTGRDHVVGVGFLSADCLLPLVPGNLSLTGTTYYFPKRQSPKWSEQFSGLFHLSPLGD